ncbi:OB-fold protein [Ferruginibacter sp. SUN002]|uniref:OB-fold protein n=1 Tax=Ferruginibacter sp. SUN002 TaxID=2937789 RepID=UPI003D361812
MSNTNKILLLAFLLVAVVALIGIVMWNKPHKNVEDANTIKVSPDDLLNEFIKDSAQARIKYISKVVEVRGEVANTFANEQFQTVILIKTSTPGVSINCTFEQKEVNIKTGTTVAIKGICDGYNGDAEMGIPGDVLLVRCYIAK